jgi:tellurite resistance protein TerC
MAIWIGFIALIFTFLALDLGVFHRKNEVVSTQSALRWTALWVTMALSFSIFVYYAYTNGWVANPGGLTGREAVVLYITGYLIEESLSMDNIFVIALIFTYFMVPKEYQHRVLFWGILGALVFRGLMIGIGAALVQRFDWMVYVFGVLLIYSAYKMLRSGEEDINPGKNPVLRIIGRFYPVLKQFRGDRFFVRLPVKNRKVWAVTPLFVALMVVETTDVMFAVDSIPAIFAITTDPFIVFTSNIFAISGTALSLLRSGFLARQIPLPQIQPYFYPVFRRGQDFSESLGAFVGSGIVGGHRAFFGGGHSVFFGQGISNIGNAPVGGGQYAVCGRQYAVLSVERSVGGGRYAVGGMQWAVGGGR